MKVGSITAGKPVLTISPEASVRDLVIMLEQHNVGALVVSSDGRAVEGIVSERDVVRTLPRRLDDLAGLTVRDLMTEDVAMCTEHTAISDLMSMMTELRVRHVPVVDEQQELLSIVSIGDVVKMYISEIDEERTALRSYITS
jgi:CBS domain-containing protein